MTCSAVSAVDERLAGTAAQVTGWVCLEYPGGWGRDILDGTALGAELADELRVRADAAGVRLMFIRRPGRSVLTGGDPGRPAYTVLLAQSHPGRSWCERLEVDEPAGLLDLDFGAVAGEAPGMGRPVENPVVLVCAHGKRDQCCAVFGRPIAAALASEFGDDVWECSHTGGHRFAPSMILLPSGYTYGRLGAAASITAVRAVRDGSVERTGLRGRSVWDARGQVAEMAVRDRVSVGTNELSVEGDTVVHVDGRRWSVEIEKTELPPRPASCGAVSKPVKPLIARDVRELRQPYQ
ncbi:sucrase ferredoxin [Rhodococcus sp. NPDC058521]|uniref:sucrase ferredoxin n=1 Tax=Rhodococcus sp. NPDC058521 TaxID=3346536 RepID=UPI00365FFC4D